MDAALTAHAIDRHNMVMMQMGRRLGLVLEALQLTRIENGGEG